MTLAEDLRAKYGLTSLKIGGNCMPLTAINEALERAAQIADRNSAYDTANQIRSLKWVPQAKWNTTKKAASEMPKDVRESCH